MPVTYKRKIETTRKCNRRKYLILPSGIWTNFIIDQITKHPKNFICNFVFKRGKVYSSGNTYIAINANCTTCHATLNGYVIDKPGADFNSVKVQFILRGFDETRHQKPIASVKNYGAGKRKAYVVPAKSSKMLHLENVEQTTDMFKLSKGRRFTANAARCGKYRENKKNKLSTCPYTALSYMKYSKTYAESIHSIGIDNFFVMYSSPNQLKVYMYKAYNQHNAYTKISCDATGGIVNKLRKLNKL